MHKSEEGAELAMLQLNVLAAKITHTTIWAGQTSSPTMDQKPDFRVAPAGEML